jgi:hypothetical protein
MKNSLPNVPDQVRALHAAWERLTGQRLVLDCMRERAWWDWIQRGLGVEDLELLLAELRARVRAGRLNPSSIKFRFIVGNPDQAEEDIAEIKARRRPNPAADAGRVAALQAAGRTGDATHQGESRMKAAPVPDAVPVADVVARLRQWREENR